MTHSPLLQKLEEKDKVVYIMYKKKGVVKYQFMHIYTASLAGQCCCVGICYLYLS